MLTSKDQPEITRKLRILRHAEETGHVTKTWSFKCVRWAFNSLSDAALMQVAMFTDDARRRYREIGATETHPKAVLRGYG